MIYNIYTEGGICFPKSKKLFIDLNKIKQILKVDEIHFYPSETTDANNYSTGASGYILYI